MKKPCSITTALAAMTICTLNICGATFDVTTFDAVPFGGKPVSSLKGMLIRQELKNNLLGQIPDSYFESQEALTQLFFDYMGINDLSNVLTEVAQECYLYTLPKAETTLAEKLKGLYSPDKKAARAHATLTLMPGWLRLYFLGVSVQDLIDHKALPKVKTSSKPITTLHLWKLRINDLTGIQNIPGIDEVVFLSVTSNLITAIPSETFSGLNNLAYLFLASNGITVIAPNGFADLDELRGLDLEENSLNTPMPGTFASLKSLITIHLTGTGISETERARIQAEVGGHVNVDFYD